MSKLARTISRLWRPRAEAPIQYVPDVGFQIGPLAGIGSVDDREQILRRSQTQSGTLFAVLDGIIGSVSSVRWHLYRTTSSGERIEITSHPALSVMQRPNRFMSWSDLVSIMILHYELVGEAYAVLSRIGRIPVEIWPIRPDRMDPKPHKTEFIELWNYRNPSGTITELPVDDILWMRRPNGYDPYHGIGPVQSVLVELDAAQYSAEWNRNFFLNSASPGGVIEIPGTLNDSQFERLMKRWRSSHKGTRNAHKVSIIEGGGKWVGTSQSMRDMDFTGLRQLSSEAIREAFRYPVPLLGTTTDVNRATAQAARGIRAEEITLPLLEQIRQIMNTVFTTQYTTGTGRLEFDFESPVQEDEELAIRRLDSSVKAAVALAGAGWDPDESLAAVGMPAITWRGQGGSPAVKITGDSKIVAMEPGTLRRVPGRTGEPHEHSPTCRYVAVDLPEIPDPPPGTPDELDADPDLDAVQAAWLKRVKKTLSAWDDVLDGQYSELTDQVRAAIDSGDITSLTNLSCPTGRALVVLSDAMQDMSETAADQAAEETEDQDVDADPVPADETWITDHATVVTAVMGAALAASAARVALQLSQAGMSGDEVATAVREHLDSLTDAQPRLAIGAALTAAQNESRLKTFAAAASDPDGPIPAYYASEVLDSNTCPECRDIDRKWLGNDLAIVRRLYPAGGYVNCLGGPRCRGTVVVVWRPGPDTERWTEKEPI